MDDITAVKQSLHKEFSMTDLGECKYYLGMTIRRDRENKTLWLGQKAYVQKILEDNGMAGCNISTTPMDPKLPNPAPPDYTVDDDLKADYAKAIGSLMYLMLGTRPDIAFPVSFLSRHVARPTEDQ